MSKEELHVLTEVGVFGALNIEDPTKKRVLKESELQELISESVSENLNNLAE